MIITDMRQSQLVGLSASADTAASLDDFNLFMQIGQGGFGRVYLCELAATRKKYAMKAIRKDKILQSGALENTILEMKILLQADHPFLCGINYVFQTQLRLYFIMPFIDGGELYKIFKVHKRFSEEETKFFAAQLIIGVGNLHDKGIVHRDLKLENIMINSNGYIKIIDFGLARLLANDELAQTHCGTAEYFAPEVLKQCGYDRMVDYWAIGILIYEMMIGITPFFSRNKHELMQNIQRKQLKFPSQQKISTSVEVKDLIAKLLNR